MLPYLLLAALFGGLLMFMLCKDERWKRVGELLFFAAVLSLLITLAPAMVAKLHS